MRHRVGPRPKRPKPSEIQRPCESTSKYSDRLLVLLLWTLVRGGERGRGAPLLWPVLAIIGAVALLTHPMTGVFGFGGLLLLALVAPADRRGACCWRSA